jgi:hypothetical protein
MSARKDIVTVAMHADPDQDDCLADAERRFIARYPVLAGWDLAPRWVDDATRMQVLLTVPAWALGDITDAAIEQLQIEAGQAGDLDMVMVCDLALHGPTYVTETHVNGRDIVRTYGTRQAARQECERVIYAARAAAESGQ